jgi:BirA family transcriptional regulator, biotin operon repressor / biotin---[acetyl-CoA-carboxylase] ligase
LRSSRSDTALPPELADAVDRARDRLGPFAGRIRYFAEIGSTNDVAASLAAEPESFGTVVIADAQTAGRGRRGRAWFSPAASGLYVSVIVAPSRGAADPERATTLLTLATGVALAEGVERASGLSPAIKWPNDLLVGRRKLAGILAEAYGDAVVLGYGINIGPMAYPPELRDRATSLETELGREIDRGVVAAETLAALAARYADLVAGRFDAILDAWRRRAPSHRGARVVWDTPAGPQSGITDGIDDRGGLLVRMAADRVERIVAGEVRWI